jgi:hypothetical protein
LPQVVFNHEVTPGVGPSYMVNDNTVELNGARMTSIDIDRETRSIIDGGLAYDTVGACV